MEYLLQFIAFYFMSLASVILYFNSRLNAQDKYLSTYIKALASHSNEDDFKIVPVELDTVDPFKEEKKPEVYSPRHDPETVLMGKVVDPFD